MMKLKKIVTIFICILAFGIFNNNVYAAVKKVNLQIKSIDNINVTITQTDSFKLPTAVKAKMNNGSYKSVSVKWDKKVNYGKIGVQSFKGTVNGYKAKVLLTLNIKDEADLNKIKKMKLYEFQLKDNTGELYDVYVYQINSKKEIASFENGSVWAGANEGDVLYDGIIKIAYSKAGSNEIKVVNHLARYWEKAEIQAQTVNTSRDLIKKIENKYEGEPDLLLIGATLCSNASSIDFYYIYNGVLKETKTAIDTCNAYDLFFRQVDNDTFESSSYDNAENFVFYIIKNKFDFSTGTIKCISEDSMTVEDYQEYSKDINTDGQIEE